MSLQLALYLRRNDESRSYNYTFGYSNYRVWLRFVSRLSIDAPQIADICAAQALRTKLIITERVNE